MNDAGQGVNYLTIDQNVHLGKFALAVADQFIIQGGIASGTGLQLVKEVKDDFT